MAQPGDLRYKDGEWEILVSTGSPYNPLDDKWVPLSDVDAEEAKNLEDYGFDDARVKNGARQFHLPGSKADDPGEWYDEDDYRKLVSSRQEAEQRIGSGKPPNWPEWRSYPPRDAKGGVDEDEIQSYWTKYESAQEKQAARQEARIEPAENYGGPQGEFVIVSPTGTISRYNAGKQEAQEDPLGTWLDRTDRQRAAVQANQPQGKALTPRQRMEQRVDDILINGGTDAEIEQALAFQDSLDRPSNIEALRLALQYAKNPEDLQTLYDWARYGLGQGAPSEVPKFPTEQEGFKEPDLSFLPPELGGQRTPLTTQELLAQGGRQANVQRMQGLSEEEIRRNVGPGFESAGGFVQPQAPGQDRRTMQVIFDQLKAQNPDAPDAALWDEAANQYGQGPSGFVLPGAAAPGGVTEAERAAAMGENRTKAGYGPGLFPGGEVDLPGGPVQDPNDARMAQEGPNLWDVPSAGEIRGARKNGRVDAPLGVIVPEFVQNNPSITFYNPNQQQAAGDWYNEVSNYISTKGGGASAEQWADVEREYRRRAGLPEPDQTFKTPQPPRTPSIGRRLSADFFQPTESRQRKIFSTPRYVPRR